MQMSRSSTTLAAMQTTGEPPPLLRLPSVMRQTGLGRSTIYRLMAERRFPKAVRLSGRAIAWRATDLRDWVDTRPSANEI